MPEIRPPFLFKRIATLASAPMGRGALIVAGPSRGKTSILEYMRGSEAQSWFVDLARPETIPSGAGDCPACVFIDNAQANEDALHALAERCRGAHIVAASDRALERADGFYPLELGRDNLADARAQHRDAWAEAWSRAYGVAWGASAPADVPTLPEEWADEMFEVTTGHPALVARAFRLTLLHFAGHRDRPHDEVCADLLRNKTFLTSQLLGDAEAVAKRIMRWLDDKPLELREILSRRGQPDQLTFDQERTLRSAGLVYGPADYLAWTSPDVLRPLIVRLASEGGRQSASTVALQGDANRATKAGTLVLYPETDAMVTLRLRGRGWELIRTLYEAEGKVVPLEKILEAMPGADSQQIVRSAVQRLSDRLRPVTSHRIIENHHGQGYALVAPPPLEK